MRPSRHENAPLCDFPGESDASLEGYASGKLIQYEIEGSKGERSMAHEHELLYQ